MQITEQWGRALGCDLRAAPAHYQTRFDDIEQFHCRRLDCSGAEAAAAVDPNATAHENLTALAGRTAAGTPRALKLLLASPAGAAGRAAGGTR